jgi:transcriptional regulator with XRE-family HTH domain
LVKNILTIAPGWIISNLVGQKGGGSVEENISKIIGKRIRSTRERKGIIQKALAEMVGVSPSAINQFEKGEKKPSAELLANIAYELGVSADYLLGASKKEDIFLTEDIASAFRDFKELSNKDKEIILENIKLLKSLGKRKEKQK